MEEIRINRQELKSLIEAVEVKITLKLEDINRRLSKLEQENDTITNNIERLERKSKENNIHIFGLKTKPEEITVDFIRQELKNLVDVNVVDSDLNNFYPLGKLNNPAIKIEFLKKMAVFKNAKDFKGTNIAIANDLTIKQRK